MAREKAEKLLADLIAQQSQLEANPPKIDAKDLADGKAALANAVASARRAAQALIDAQRIGFEGRER